MKRFIVLLVLCMFLSICAVQAADVNQTSEITGDVNGMGDFDELAREINNTGLGDTLNLQKDYKNKNGKNIIISKSITIDGKGHTLDANRKSRIFNVTADNVVVKNIIFTKGASNGNIINKSCGGALYWSGANGSVVNCSFIDNDAWANLPNPGGMIIMGAKTSFGGAIYWTGENGTVLNSKFIENDVGYANDGGAIYWTGNNGKINNSYFTKNGAWVGAAIYWGGDNGSISYSKIVDNHPIVNEEIVWVGKNGSITHSVLLASGNNRYFLSSEHELKANYNWWGNTFNDCNSKPKTRGNVKIDNSFVLFITVTKKTLSINQKSVIYYDLHYLYDYKGHFQTNDDITPVKFTFKTVNGAGTSGNGKITFKPNDAPKASLTLAYKNFKHLINFKINSKAKLYKNKDLTKYYKSSKKYKVSVLDMYGNIAKKETVTFKINSKTYNVKTNSKGVASLKINQKPGKYKVIAEYKGLKVKNRIIVKNVLFTKNISKKVKKSAKFKVKLLNSKGKAFSKQIVKVKFKGKIHKIRTNNRGIAVFKIKNSLKVGKYKIKTSYKGLVNVNRVIVKK